MAGSHYIVTNLLDSLSATLSVSPGVASGSAVANLTNTRAGKRCISSATLATSPQHFAADWGGAPSTVPDTVALINHNLPSDATVKLQTDDNSGFSSPTDLITFTYREFDMYATFTGNSERYWRILVTAGATTSVTPTIGEWVLGVRTQLTRQFTWGSTWGEAWNNAIHETLGGSLWTLNLAKNLRRWVLDYADLSEAEKEEVRDLLNATKGGATPFTWIPDPDNSTAAEAARVYYVHASDVFEYTDGFNKDITGLELRMQSRGLEI